MALSNRLVTSFGAISSPSLCFLKPNNCQKNNSVVMGFRSSYQPLIVNCSSDEMEPTSDPMNLSSMKNNGISKPPYKWHRVLLKVSGEALAGDQKQNIDPKITMAIAREVASVTRLGIEEIK